MRLGRAPIAPFDHRLDLLARPLKDCFDAAVIEVAHPADKPQTLGVTAAVVPVADALDDPGDEEVRADHQSFRKTPTTTPWMSTRSTS